MRNELLFCKTKVPPESVNFLNTFKPAEILDKENEHNIIRYSSTQPYYTLPYLTLPHPTQSKDV